MAVAARREGEPQDRPEKCRRACVGGAWTSRPAKPKTSGDETEDEPKPRRGRRGGRGRRGRGEGAEPVTEAGETVEADSSPMVERPIAEEPPIAEAEPAEDAKTKTRRRPRAQKAIDDKVAEAAPAPAAEPEAPVEADAKPKRRSRAKKAEAPAEAAPEPAPAPLRPPTMTSWPRTKASARTASRAAAAHSRLALKAGVSAETVDAIAQGRRPERLTEDEAILYDLSTELQHHKSVSDATYARAVARYGEQGVIDAVGITGYYTLLAMVLNTARTPLAPGRTPGMPPFTAVERRPLRSRHLTQASKRADRSSEAPKHRSTQEPKRPTQASSAHQSTSCPTSRFLIDRHPLRTAGSRIAVAPAARIHRLRQRLAIRLHRTAARVSVDRARPQRTWPLDQPVGPVYAPPVGAGHRSPCSTRSA